MSPFTRWIRSAPLAALVLLLLPGAARAQAACAALMPPARVGDWAEWRHAEERLVRMAVVGEETRGGTAMIWMEVQIKEGDGAGTIMKFLVPGFPYEMKGVEEVVMKPAGQPAVKLPSQMIQMMREQLPEDPTADLFRRCEQVERLGSESITVPAGTFRAEKMRDPASGDLAWISRDVPFGMVRAEVKDAGVIVLAGHGRDARTAITESPRELPGL